MSQLRQDMDRIETMAVRAMKQLQEVDRRLERLEQAVLELSGIPGEESTPTEEMEPSEGP